MRDIDLIITAVTQHIPDVVVTQYRPTHSADDNGIWWFSRPSQRDDIQIESSSGQCPFLVETDQQSSYAARTAYTLLDAITMIIAYLAP